MGISKPKSCYVIVSRYCEEHGGASAKGMWESMPLADSQMPVPAISDEAIS